jgi:KDO2-lipid IV(A) lauroyltransferase
MSEKRSRRRWKRDKKNRPIEHRLQYLGLRLLVTMMGCFPMGWNLYSGRLIGRFLWRFYKRGRDRALSHLQESYPDQSDAWTRATGKRSFEQLGMLAVDAMLTPKLVFRHNWRQYACFKNTERVKWMLQGGQSLLLVTGHYGNFEIMGYMFSLFGFNLFSIARPLDNPFVDRYLRSIREEHGQRIIDKKGAADMMTLVSQKGAALGIVADQDAGHKGIFVNFFGRKASTYKSIALLALTQNTPIAIGGARRIGNRFYFEMFCNRLILPEEWADQDDPITWITQEYTAAIEDFVREDPTQYWWIHRRWKTRPKPKKPSACSV